MTNIRKFSASLAAVVTMLIIMLNQAAVGAAADEVKYRTHKDQNLGDYGQYNGGYNKFDYANWVTDNYSDHLTICFSERNLDLYEPLQKVTPNDKKREIYFYKQLSNGKWQRSKQLRYTKYGEDDGDYGHEYVHNDYKNLKPATKYTFKMLTRLKYHPDVRCAIKFTTMTTPEKVTNVTGHASTKAVRLNWKKVKCSGYKIQQYNSKTGLWKTVKLVNKNSTTARVSGLNSGKRYKFRIVAYSKLKNTKVYNFKTDKWKKGSETYPADPSKTITLTTKK